MHVKFFGVKPNALVESSSLTVIKVHCHIHLKETNKYLDYQSHIGSKTQNQMKWLIIKVHVGMKDYREAEESRPQLCLPVIEELRLCLEQSREEITMTVLILAPVLKVLENGVALVLRIGLEMSVYRNVPPVSNFLRQIRSIENELRLEESIFPCLCQEPQVQCQIEIRQTLVQEPAIQKKGKFSRRGSKSNKLCRHNGRVIVFIPSMPGFIPGHKRENLCYHRISFLKYQSMKWLIE